MKVVANRLRAQDQTPEIKTGYSLLQQIGITAVFLFALVGVGTVYQWTLSTEEVQQETPSGRPSRGYYDTPLGPIKR